jgi:hypothetical protein
LVKKEELSEAVMSTDVLWKLEELEEELERTKKGR